MKPAARFGVSSHLLNRIHVASEEMGCKFPEPSCRSPAKHLTKRYHTYIQAVSLFGIQVSLEAGPFRLCSARCCHEYSKADLCINYNELSESWKFLVLKKSEEFSRAWGGGSVYKVPGGWVWAPEFESSDPMEMPGVFLGRANSCTPVLRTDRRTHRSSGRWDCLKKGRKVMMDVRRPTSKSLKSSSDLQLVLACFYPHLHKNICTQLLIFTHVCACVHTHTVQTKKMKRTKMSSFVPKTYLHPALCQISDFVYFMFWDFLHQFKVNRRQEVEDRGLQKLVYTSSVMSLVPFTFSRKPVTSSSGSCGKVWRALCWETDFWTEN